MNKRFRTVIHRQTHIHKRESTRFFCTTAKDICGNKDQDPPITADYHNTNGDA